MLSLVEGKIRKVCLKLRIKKTKVAKHTWRKFLENCKKNTFFQLNFFKKKKQESRVCPKKVILYQFKMGWFKAKTGTNLRPENYMYLSAPGLFKATPISTTGELFYEGFTFVRSQKMSE